MKTPLKVGDRVAIYGMVRGDNDRMYSFSGYNSATVSETYDSGFIHAKDEDGLVFYLHPKQCRRLKPRAKAREWTLVESDGLIHAANGPRLSRCESVVVREVRAKGQ